MAARYSEEKFMAKIASRAGELPTSELFANLRSDTMQRRASPGGGYYGALNHVVTHGLDVTVPLGAPRRLPDETIRIVLDDLTGGDVHARFGASIETQTPGHRPGLVIRIGTAAARRSRGASPRALRPDTPSWTDRG